MGNDISKKVIEAKTSMKIADSLISEYLPFIKSEASKVSKRHITDSDDELSIGMIGFHEAIKSYEVEKGNFISYASIIIKNKIIDFYRKESRHFGHDSLEKEIKQEDLTLKETLEDEKNHFEERDNLYDTKNEIMELTEVLRSFGLDLTDISDNTPKQERTLQSCRDVVNFVIDNPIILEEIAKSGKLPIKLLSSKTKVSKKTIERHRKYILAVTIIQTNGFENIRNHLKEVLNIRKGAKIWLI